MFGYLAAITEMFDEQQMERYKACYCGLCRSLKERHGELPRFTLNYDMSFLILLLSSQFEPQETETEKRCIAHPCKARRSRQSEITDYAADMNVALAYLKCLDDWQDDSNFLSLAAAGALKSAYKAVSEKYPRQCDAMKRELDALHEMEKRNDEDIDAASSCFGRLMAEVLVYREDRWSGTLRGLGMALGKAVYVMDACMDLDSDAVHNRYNPLRRYYGLPNNEERFRAIIKMLMGECVRLFDILPLVQDAEIMKNILCFGFWAQFERKYGKEKGPLHVSGSV